jgi:hypothetical protein
MRMTPEDRNLLARLRAEEEDLRRALGELSTRLGELESRARANGTSVEARPPTLPTQLPPLPSVEPHESFSPADAILGQSSDDLPPPPLEAILPPLPPAELPPVPPPRQHIEFRIGRWITRIGALFVLLALISADAYWHLHRFLNRPAQLALMGAISVILVAVGRRLQQRDLPVYGRTLMAAGLGGLYFTLYAATAIPPWQLVTNPIAGGLILLLWSVYVFDLARRMQSQPLALLALTLAYVTTSLNPVARFTLGADLLLAGTSVLFLLRYGWLALAFVGLAGTYAALARQLLYNQYGEFTFDTSRSLAFAPHAVYLVAAWGAFTAAVLFAPRVKAGARFVLLTLNNVLASGLLALSAIICGYGTDRTGWVLLLSGAAVLGTGAVARLVRPETSGAYAAQGLALATGGIMAVCTGATRGVLLLVETLLLALGGAISRSRILEVCAWVTAFFATGFLIWNVTVEVRDPWLLGLGGAAVMLKCAWWTRRGHRAPHFAWPASLYCGLSLALLGSLLATQLDNGELPPWLALAALGATLLGMALRLGELPPLAQVMLLAAQGLALDPGQNGVAISSWSAGWVILATLGMLLAARGNWLKLLDPLYALALVGLLDHLIHPRVTEPGWMIAASVLALAFLVVGAFARIWSLAAAGQLFLAAAVYHFFRCVPGSPWAAAVPLAVVFATGRSIHGWLRTFPEITGVQRQLLRTTAFLYQLLALVMLIDALCVLLPPRSLAPTFLLLGTLVLSLNTQRMKPFGVRCSFVLSGLGAVLIFFTPFHPPLTFLSALALISFLTQPAILAHAPRLVSTQIEAWVLILVSSATGWFAVSTEAAARWGSGAITTSWAVYALVLFLAGFFLHESRQRWCGLAVLLAAILRVFAVDFWVMSSGFRVLTFVVLALVTLGLGFLYARYAERLRTLL